MNALAVIVFAAAVASASAGALVGAPVAYAGQVSTQAGSFNSGTHAVRFSQSARPVSYAAAAPVAYAQAAPVAYAQPAFARAAPLAYAQPAYAHAAPVAYARAPVAYAQPAYAAPAVAAAPIGSHVAYGYTPLATSLLG